MSSRTRFAALLSAAALATTMAVAAVGPAHSAEPSALPGSDAHCQTDPIYAAYYRQWGDVNAPGIEGERNRFDDLPPGVDIAFAFGPGPDGSTPEGAAYWDLMKNTYIPNLSAQGTVPVKTQMIERLLELSPAVDAAQADYDKAAKDLVDLWITERGFKGLDIDMEASLSPDSVTRATRMFEALSTHIGPQSGTDLLFIYDTNRSGDHALIQNVAPYVSLVLIQSYGRNTSGLQATWDSYAGLIHPCQYLIGFSFYEENGAYWGDVTQPFEESRAAYYATWQPSGLAEGQAKGGSFSYAIDRDGKVQGDDVTSATTFDQSKYLISLMDQKAGWVPQPPPAPSATLAENRRTLTGTGIANSTITVKSTGRGKTPATATTTVDTDGKWTIQLSSDLRPRTTLSVTQQWWNTAPSTPVEVTLARR